VADIMMKRAQIKFSRATCRSPTRYRRAPHYHTRYPLVEAATSTPYRLCQFQGHRDRLHINPKDPSLRGVMRPVPSVAETENASACLTN